MLSFYDLPEEIDTFLEKLKITTFRGKIIFYSIFKNVLLHSQKEGRIWFYAFFWKIQCVCLVSYKSIKLGTPCTCFVRIQVLIKRMIPRLSTTIIRQVNPFIQYRNRKTADILYCKRLTSFVYAPTFNYNQGWEQ